MLSAKTTHTAWWDEGALQGLLLCWSLTFCQLLSVCTYHDWETVHKYSTRPTTKKQKEKQKKMLKYLTITSTGRGNGNPLQYSYLENSMDSGAWRATVLGVAETDITKQTFISFPIHHFLPEIASLFVFIFWSMFLGAYNVRTILLLNCPF